jgi:oxygen-dependent protoporphyrinogen oxidase
LGVRRSDVRRDIQTFGFVVPMSENRRILAGSFASHKFAGRAPEDHVLIRVFIGGSMQSQLLDESDDQLVKIAREELAELIGLEGTPIVTRVVRWNDAMPQYHVGHRQRVEQIEQAMREVPRLSLVNNALHGVGIAPVIQAADRVAKEVVASFTGSSDASRCDRTQA